MEDFLGVEPREPITEEKPDEPIEKPIEEPIGKPEEITKVVEPDEPIIEDVEQERREEQSKTDVIISTLQKENSAYKQEISGLGDRLVKLETPPQAVLTRPIKPVKPQGFNRVDGQTDPETPSYAYNEAIEQYRFEMDDYNEKREIAMDEANQKAQIVKDQSDLAGKHIAAFQKEGLNPADAIDCWNFYWQNADSQDPKFLVENWKLKEHGKPRPKDPEKLKTPPPPGVGGGLTTDKTKTNTDLFNEGLMKGEDSYKL